MKKYHANSAKEKAENSCLEIVRFLKAPQPVVVKVHKDLEGADNASRLAKTKPHTKTLNTIRTSNTL